MRKAAFDIGDVRIGIATSDMLGIIASGYETYTRKGDESDYRYLADFCRDKQVDTIVVGLPINMDGTEGERVQKTREFVHKLSAFTDIKTVFQDERLTTVQAERILIQSGVRRDKRKQVIDKVAATIILQSFLDKY
ncbi:MAG: Holliday junction resolvase RuvX [Clostridia bacterium]|nr:Holliday junction resolvase RuvX [Clostridia bacterium]